MRDCDAMTDEFQPDRPTINFHVMVTMCPSLRTPVMGLYRSLKRSWNAIVRLRYRRIAGYGE